MFWIKLILALPQIIRIVPEIIALIREIRDLIDVSDNKGTQVKAKRDLNNIVRSARKEGRNTVRKRLIDLRDELKAQR